MTLRGALGVRLAPGNGIIGGKNVPARTDHAYIESRIPSGARVLDLGCGDGTLIERLARDKGCDVLGIDIDEQAVRECVARGVSVHHGDMLEGMASFPDHAFDCVILSQTLQQALRPAAVIEEMLRVGRRAIISFPNFGQWKVRLQLLLRGRMPVTGLLPYSWHETPNVHLLTVRDFRRFCSERGLRIIDRAFFSASFARLPGFGANALAAMAAFVVERNGSTGREV